MPSDEETSSRVNSSDTMFSDEFGRKLSSRNLKNLSEKISKFLVRVELEHSIISNENKRKDLEKLLDYLFEQIQIKNKISVFYKNSIMSFQFNFWKDKFLKRTATKIFCQVEEHKRPVLIKKFDEDELKHLYSADYLIWLVLDKLDLQCKSCIELVKDIIDIGHFKISKLASIS
jgi:hypothetical protein